MACSSHRNRKNVSDFTSGNFRTFALQANLAIGI
jgi:hypothetical protein